MKVTHKGQTIIKFSDFFFFCADNDFTCTLTESIKDIFLFFFLQTSVKGISSGHVFAFMKRKEDIFSNKNPIYFLQLFYWIT